MLDEEKLAHDVYSFFAEKYSLPIFKNITKAEQQHYSSVLAMIKKYDIKYTKATEQGKFMNSKFEQLYQKFTQQGSVSITEALKVGAEIEDLDIYDLNKALTNDVDNNDINIVYKNIRQGSYHHLKAFTNILKRYGESYTPKYLTVEQYNEILNK